MHVELQDLIQALREEVTQYGELLALIENQQHLILGSSAEGLLDNLRSIHAQVPLVEAARQHRDECRRALASALGQPAHALFSRLKSAIPPHYRALLEALIEEVNGLLARSQERLRQNHLLLTRSLSSVHRIMRDLVPSCEEQLACP